MSALHAVSAYSPEAASTRVRLYDWFAHLEITPIRHDYRGTRNNRPRAMLGDPVGTLRAERSLRTLKVTGAHLILSREASPLSRGQVEERLLRQAAHSVYDFDDALFHDTGRARRLLGRTDACRRSVSSASVVLAGNDYLADWASDHATDVRVIPSCIEPDDYQPKLDWEIGRERPRLVWLGSPSTEQYVADIAPALLRVHAATGAELVLISGSSPTPALAPLEGMLRHVPWSMDTFATHLAGADVAIAPLEDTPWARGKCAYKLLQYAGSALPMVGSPVGANSLALQRFAGSSATTNDEWVEALVELLDAPATRRAAMGVTALGAVREHYSFDAWADAWRSAVLPT